MLVERDAAPQVRRGSGYRLPQRVDAGLTAALMTLKNCEAAKALAVFLARFHTAPGRLGRAFPVDRIALAEHAELQLTEARVRGALAALERIGFLVREAMPGSAYKRTAKGLHRKPVWWRFAPEFLAAFERANAAAQARRGAGSVARRPLAPSAPPRSSVSVPARPLAQPAIQVTKRQNPAEALSLGEKKPAVSEGGLEAALDRWRKALEGKAA